MRRLTLTLAVLALPLAAAAETSLVVGGTRVELREIAPSAPEAVRELDLGPAPPPGGSALLDPVRVAAQIRAAGVEPRTVKLPRVLRVVGASQRWSPAELSAFVRGAVEDALPRGVGLAHLEAKTPLVTSPDATVGHAEIPKPPKRVGPFRTAIVVPIVVGGEIAARVTLTATLDVSESAARPDVGRGTRVTLVIDRRSARIGAAGIALADADVGELAEFRVDKTGRVVRARIEAEDLASVVSP
jgi:hypothetical protein